MRQLTQRLELACEQIVDAPLMLGAALRRWPLQRDFLAGHSVVYGVHMRHAAVAQNGQPLVALSDEVRAFLDRGQQVGACHRTIIERRRRLLQRWVTAGGVTT